MRRRRLSKRRSGKIFRRGRRTKSINRRTRSMRGGYRM